MNQITQTSPDVATVHNFSSTDDAQWAGTMTLDPKGLLPLKQHARNDIYVIEGSLINAHRRYLKDTFIGVGEQSASEPLWAGPDGARLFIYCDQFAVAGENDIVAPHERMWRQGGAEGIQVAQLPSHTHSLMLVHWQAGARMGFHRHPHGEEIFVLTGELKDQRGHYPAGTWQRLYADTGHAPYVEQETMILLRNGHLRDQ
ncbi:MAG: cupin domain-containing protein [Burkholderiales bacterium]|nr:cupin domain-containing protein [Burkholderiales bacterium]MBI3729209.1 cupin domain-containing protein [Burkholderiales bacterium]